jgi:hypothetical protein
MSPETVPRMKSIMVSSLTRERLGSYPCESACFSDPFHINHHHVIGENKYTRERNDYHKIEGISAKHYSSFDNGRGIPGRRRKASPTQSPVARDVRRPK